MFFNKEKKKNKTDTNDAWVTEAAIDRRRKHVLDIGDIFFFLKRIITIAFCVFVFFGFIFGIKPMNNDDMKPHFGAGDVLFYYRWDRNFVSQDVVVYKAEDKTRVGRIVARPSDMVNIENNGLEVNGYNSYEGDIFYETKPYDEGIDFPINLGSDEYFILADYREGARDSRYYGAISDSQIKGKVIFVVRWLNL